jgi:NADH dehydrogenase
VNGMERRHRVVVVGAGFGGLTAAKGFRRSPVDVTVLDANNLHTFQPFLYQVATAGLDADDVAYAVRGVFRRQRNVEVHMARVTGIDLDGKQLTLDRAGVTDTIEYDSLVLAAGAISTTYGVPGVEEHAVPLKTLEDALRLRLKILERFEQASSDPSLIQQGRLNVVVCGGGPTGVELAGATMELFTKVLAKDFPTLNVRAVRVVLVEAAPRLLGSFSEKSGERARRTLTRRGVEVRVGVGVDKIVEGAVHLVDGSVIPAGTVAWTAGVRANPLAESIGLELTKGGRIVVNPDLSVPGHPEVFVVGDIAASPARPDGDGLLPQVAQPAIQGGRHAARQIIRRLDGLGTEPFRYHDKGSMATIGRSDAIAEFPNGWRLQGFIGWLAWLGLHLLYLIGFRNRANVLVNWAWNYLTYDRGSRIVGDADLNRVPDP